MIETISFTIAEGHISVNSDSGPHSLGLSADTYSLEEAAKKAAFLRANDIPAEVVREEQRIVGRKYLGPFSNWVPAKLHVTVPKRFEKKAIKLLQEFKELDKREYEECQITDDDFTGKRIRFAMENMGGIIYYAWYGVFNHCTAVSYADYGIAAFHVGGEVWERYKNHFKDKFAGSSPLHKSGFFHCGAAWAFNDDFTAISERWEQQEEGTDWLGYPKYRWGVVESFMTEKAINGEKK